MGVVSAVLALALPACEFDRTAAPLGRERPVVHAVLNPVASEVVILVERSLTGAVAVDEEALFDPRDPIVTGNGVPISGAVVEIAGPAGATARAIEDAEMFADGRGRGVYRVRNSRNQGEQNIELRPNVRYTLRVVTPGGQVVTGSALIPDARPSVDSPPVEPFDRDRDTLRLRWERASGAKRYSLRVDSPFGPFYLFTDTTELTLSGGLRNLFADELPRLFIPGFDQTVQVAAVDTNFVDYYRSGNDPFTGTGLINRLEGGVGLFGAYVPLDTRVLEVTADSTAPAPAGRYVGEERLPPDELRLFVESSRGARTRLTGRLTLPLGDRLSVTGLLESERLTLAALTAQSVADTQFVFRGRLAGDSITGVWEARGEQRSLSSRYRRQQVNR